jgi:hypothetical protein
MEALFSTSEGKYLEAYSRIERKVSLNLYSLSSKALQKIKTTHQHTTHKEERREGGDSGEAPETLP